MIQFDEVSLSYSSLNNISLVNGEHRSEEAALDD